MGTAGHSGTRIALAVSIVAALVGIGLGMFAAAQVGPAVWTGKADYGPNELVDLHGSGLASGSLYRLLVVWPDGSARLAGNNGAVLCTDPTVTDGTSCYDEAVADRDGFFLSKYQLLNGAKGTYQVHVYDQTAAIVASGSFTDDAAGPSDPHSHLIRLANERPGQSRPVDATQVESQRRIFKNPRGVKHTYALAVFSNGENPLAGGLAGGLWLLRSTDNGTTWSQVARLFQDNGNPPTVSASLWTYDDGSQLVVYLAYAAGSDGAPIRYRRMGISDAGAVTIGVEQNTGQFTDGGSLQPHAVRPVIVRDRQGRAHIAFWRAAGKLSIIGTQEVNPGDAPTWSAAQDVLTTAGAGTQDVPLLLPFAGSGNLLGFVGVGRASTSSPDNALFARNIAAFDGTAYSLGSLQNLGTITRTGSYSPLSGIVDSSNVARILYVKDCPDSGSNACPGSGSGSATGVFSRRADTGGAVESWAAAVRVSPTLAATATLSLDAARTPDRLYAFFATNAGAVSFKTTNSDQVDWGATGCAGFGGTVNGTQCDFLSGEENVDWLSSSVGGPIQLLWTRQVVGSQIRHAYFDTVPPSVTVSFTPDGSNGWFKSSPAAGAVSAADDAQVASISCVDSRGGLSEGPLSGGGTPSAARDLSVAGDASDHNISCTATDGSGNSATASVIVRIDTIAPSAAAHVNPASSAAGWNNSPVTVSFTGSDAGSGVVSCSPDQLFSTETPGVAASGTCADAAGNTSAEASVVVRIDLTPPTIAGTRAPEANAAGWNNADVTVTFDCTDALSGVGLPPAPVALSDEGAGQSASGSCTDRAGNVATTSEDGINIDKTPPSVAGSRDPAANANGWNNSDVVVSFACTDGLSGVGAAPEGVLVNTEGAGQSATGTCTDNAGNVAQGTVGGINIDKTPPTAGVSVSPAANAQGWNNAPVTVSFGEAVPGTDLSGIESCSAPVALSDETAAGGTSVSGTCADKAGNVSAPASATVKIDMTAPMISGHSSPEPNGNGWNNTDVTISFECTDALSGVLSSSGPPFVWGQEGAQSFTGICLDNAGNSAETVVAVQIDKVPPAAPSAPDLVAASDTGTSSTDNITEDSTPQFEGTAEAVSTVDVFEGDTLAGATLVEVSGHWTFLITTSLTPGWHTFTGKAVDPAGNVSPPSDSLSILVDPASLLVKLIDGLSTDQQAAVVARDGGIETSAIQALRLHVVELPASELDATLAKYQADPQVESAEVNKTREAEAIPSDPLYPDQWALPKIGWDQVYGVVNPAGTAKVAVLDTGVDASHPDLAGWVVPGSSVLDSSDGLIDPNGHGTELAGIVAAVTDNGSGVAGVGYEGVQIMPVTVLGPDGTGRDSDIIAGVLWAADHGADVVLMAFSNPGFSQNLQDAIDYAWSRGVVLVAATGNDGVNTPTFPAGDRGVIGTSATDQDDQLAANSNYGQDVFLAGPGVSIFTTGLNSAYAMVSGTSAGSAYVAGVAGFMKAVDPSLSNGIIVGRMARTADAAGTVEQTGNGRVNMARALGDTSADPLQPAGAAPVGDGGPYVGPYLAANKNLDITFAGTGGGTISFSGVSPTPPTPLPCTATAPATCSRALDNNASGTITLALSASSAFVGWSGSFVSLGTTTCTGTAMSCTFSMGNKAQTLTATFSANATPTVAPTNGSVTVNEGATAGNTGPYSDTNTGDNVTISASVGTVTKTGTNGGTWNWLFSTTDGPAQSQTVTITAKDNSGASNDTTTTSFTLTVNNVAPTGTLANDGPVNEGSTATISFSGQSDPSSADTAAGFHYAYSCTNGDLSGATYAGSGSSASTGCTFDDNGTSTVKARIIDKDGGFTEYTTDVTVQNVAPTGTLANNGPVNEGSAATISFSGQSDPSSADTAAGFHYAYSCTNGDLSGATYAGSGSSASTGCTFDDNGTSTVKARIIDKDGGFTEYTTDVTVQNVAPTGTFGAPASVDEGTSINLSLSSPADPSSADTAAGFQYAFDCGSGYGSFSGTSTASCPTTDNGTPTVKGQIKDKDGGVTEYTAVVAVNNVAPTATPATDQTAQEGGTQAFNLGSFSDPGTDSPWTVDVDWGDGKPHTSFSVGATGPLSVQTYTYDDNGNYTVTVKVTDKDGDFDSTTFAATVSNVAPTATLMNNGPVNEGSPATVSFSAQYDPSGADSSAGFHYAFSCTNGDLSGATYAGSGSSASTGCTFDDNGTSTVKARIIDKDDGYTEYTTAVVVNNVAPTVNASFTNSTTPCGASNGTLRVEFTDPGDDAWTITIDWGDGSAPETLSGERDSTISRSHTYAAAGPHNATVTVTDDDGEVGSDNSNAVTVNFTLVDGGILPPLSSSSPKVFKFGSTIPSKIQPVDCDGSYPSWLAPTIRAVLLSSGTPDSTEILVESTSAADTTGVMRFDSTNDQYIYNLATKSNLTKNKSYRLIITIPLTGQVIYADFGLK